MNRRFRFWRIMQSLKLFKTPSNHFLRNSYRKAGCTSASLIEEGGTGVRDVYWSLSSFDQFPNRLTLLPGNWRKRKCSLGQSPLVRCSMDYLTVFCFRNSLWAVKAHRMQNHLGSSQVRWIIIELSQKNGSIEHLTSSGPLLRHADSLAVIFP